MHGNARSGAALTWRGRGLALLCAALSLAQPVAAEVPALPTVTPVPPSSQPPLSSATRPGTEYSDLAKAGYIETEYYLSGVGPAITAAGKTLFDAPYITRILVRRPADPAGFNGTVIIEPFSWFGERGAGWILTRDYLLRKGYAYVGYTLNINAPRDDPKFPDSKGKEGAGDPNRLYKPIVNFDFIAASIMRAMLRLAAIMTLCGLRAGVFRIPSYRNRRRSARSWPGCSNPMIRRGRWERFASSVSMSTAGP